MKKITEFANYAKYITKFNIPKIVAPSLISLSLFFSNPTYSQPAQEQPKMNSNTVTERVLSKGDLEKQIRKLEEQIKELINQDNDELSYTQRLDLELEVLKDYRELLNLEKSEKENKENIANIVRSINKVLTEWSDNASINEVDDLFKYANLVEKKTNVENRKVREVIYKLGETRKFNEQLSNDDWDNARRTAEVLARLSSENMEEYFKNLKGYLTKITADELLANAEKNFENWQKNKDSRDYRTKKAAQESLDKSYELLIKASNLDSSRITDAKRLHDFFLNEENKWDIEKFTERIKRVYERLPVNIWDKPVNINEELKSIRDDINAKKRKFTKKQLGTLEKVIKSSYQNALRRAYQFEADKAEEQLYNLRFESVATHDLLAVLSQPEGLELYKSVIKKLVNDGVVPENWSAEDVAYVTPEEVLNRMKYSGENTFVAKALKDWKEHKELIKKYNDGKTEFVEKTLEFKRKVKDYISNISELWKVNEDVEKLRSKLVKKFGEKKVKELDNTRRADYGSPLQNNYLNAKERQRVLQRRVNVFRKENTEGSFLRQFYDNFLGGRTLEQAVKDYRAEEEVRETDARVRFRQNEERFLYHLVGPVRAVEKVLRGLGDFGQAGIDLFKEGPRDALDELKQAGGRVLGAVDDVVDPVRLAKGIVFHPLESLTDPIPYVGSFVKDVNDSTPLQDPFSGRDNSYDNHLRWNGPRNGYVDVIKREVKEFGTYRAAQRAVIRALVDGYFVKKLYDELKSDNNNHNNNNHNNNNNANNGDNNGGDNTTDPPVDPPGDNTSTGGGLGGGDIIFDGVTNK